MIVTYWSGLEGLVICAKCGAAILDEPEFQNIHDNWHRGVDPKPITTVAKKE